MLSENVWLVADKAGVSLTLSDAFEDNLQQTLDKYNNYAKSGKDLDFHRGETNFGQQWTWDHQGGKAPNKCMCALDTSEGFYGVILGP